MSDVHCDAICTANKCVEVCDRYRTHKGDHYHFVFSHEGDYLSTYSWQNEADHELRELIKEMEKPE